MKKMQHYFILVFIVLAQFLCTSVWFTGNAVLPSLIEAGKLPASFLPHITSAVQFGFIIGTFLFAFLAIADRFSPSLVFFICALLAALFNLAICIESINVYWILAFRLLNGFFLAGIYPVGMKIAADHFQKGLGKSLGFLVGALVLGKAAPFLISSFISNTNWQYSFYATSSMSVIGGFLIFLFVPDGPHRVVPVAIHLNGFMESFRIKKFRSSAFGYFGHMWELYTFWAFVPIIIKQYVSNHLWIEWNIPAISFIVIGVGSIACMLSGLLSSRVSPKKIATIALLLSTCCCILSPIAISNASPSIFLVFLLFWGIVVIADSPMFSTLIANSAIPKAKAASLTIVNCIGFAITIISIQFLGFFSSIIQLNFLFILLAIGPILGLLAMKYD